MAHFAQLNEDNIVLRVVVLDNIDIQDHRGSEQEALGIAYCHELWGEDLRWVQTSYNAKRRGCYASIGFHYIEDRDVFVPPKPFPSWKLHPGNLEWAAPVPLPSDYGVEVKKDKFVEYDWDEHDLRWRNRREVQFFPPPVDMGMAPDESHWILYDFNHDTQVWENRREIPVE